MKSCKLAHCENKHYGAGFCNVHYQCYQRTGSAERKTYKSETGICTIEECNRPHQVHGYCSKHAQQFKKHGDPLFRRTKMPRAEILARVIHKRKATAINDAIYSSQTPCKEGHIGQRYIIDGSCRECKILKAYRSNDTANRKRRLMGKSRTGARVLAQAKGKTFYFTGRKCPNGHIAVRSTSNMKCRVCYLAKAEQKRKTPDYMEQQAHRYRQWRENNRPHVNAQVRLRTLRKRQAVPPWADVKAIEQIYKKCPEGYHVDHIVPLQGKLASGLHVSENLQYLPAVENIVKRNRFEPIYE